jgi:hypothetical protein
VQKVVVEHQAATGAWQEIASRYTIEFRSKAARPVSKLRREFTAPAAGPNCKLRLRIAGVGQVAVSHIALTDGANVLHPKPLIAKKVLGVPAPTHGFPIPSDDDERSVLLLDFSSNYRA